MPGPKQSACPFRSFTSLLGYELLELHIVILRDHFRRLFSNHNGSSIGVRTDYIWHDTGIRNSQPLDPKHAQARINHIADTAGAALVIKRI